LLAKKPFKSGAMGSIYPCKRRSDGLKMIAKCIAPGPEAPQDLIESEIKVMLLNSGESIIKCYDSIEFAKKYWLLLERMEGDLEDVLKFCKEKELNYNENFCKYVLYRSL
jgi:serine/threonine protein kinase